MSLEEFRKNRKARLQKLSEDLSIGGEDSEKTEPNMPDIKGGDVHGEIDAVMFDAIKSSQDRDKRRKEMFKDKNKETRDFIKAQDKQREFSAEDKSERRLMLDESLFTEDFDEPEFDYEAEVDEFYNRFDPEGDPESGIVVRDWRTLRKMREYLDEVGISYQFDEIDEDDEFYGEAIGYLTFEE